MIRHMQRLSAGVRSWIPVAVAFALGGCSGKESSDEEFATDAGSSGDAMDAASPVDAVASTGDGAAVDAAVASGAGDGTADGDGRESTFTLASSAFSESTLPLVYQCYSSPTSPPLSWTPGPLGSDSYAVVLTDTTPGDYYWILWDIPGTTMSLPQGVDESAMPSIPQGSEQATANVHDAGSPGYAGPCTPIVGAPFTFTLYALNVATLPGVTPASSAADVVAAIEANAIASTALTVLGSHYRS
jgi:Raf kinase inhibitor-like YbhB/YbcL family protein